ncbi:hypothetical protein WMY93_008948 [Mugilogobius chulae]|uniref:ribonuclease H n=1 Tax=Mugilogobius chulae TaxID=88201 RepID=A0AAW0P9Z0_9GOBI
MSLLGHSIADLSPVQGQGEEKVNVSLSMPPVSSVASPVLLPPGPDPREAIRQSRAHLLSMPDLNPPEVQRLVVEHIVKNDDSMLHTSTQRLRVFSGRFPRPQNESDYETFRSAVDLMLKDPSVSDLQRSRRIIESLLPPAADMVKHLRADTAPTVYIQILDSAYGAVQDGDELHAKFMDTFQDAGEKPSSYLQRLQVVLSAAVKRGGVSPSEIDRQLLNQFCRGCWDNTLISELQLKSRKSNPPSFADLLLLLRTEEDREAAKTQRMKQHLGACKVKAVSHVHYAGAGGEEKPQTTLEQLAKQLAEMQKQLNALTAAQSTPKPPISANAPPGRRYGERQGGGKSQANSPPVLKPGYCYSDFVGADTEVATLALVVPDIYSESQSQILIGMNTLDPLYEQHVQTEFVHYVPVMQGYRAVLNLLQCRYQKSKDCNDGVVRLANNRIPTVIPAGETVVVEGSIHASSTPLSSWALVEHPTTALPGGLCVQNCLITLSHEPHQKIPIVLTNESEQSITIPPLSVIAELVMSPQILSHSAAPDPDLTKKPLIDPAKFDFGDSPVPPDWKERIIQTFQNIPEVFAQHELDFGRTDKVKHKINLLDNTAFKHRPRPIHPNDIEAVRKHLQELLDVGVIRESESPFASPIVVVRKKNGDVRLCIDYRKLNLQTIKDAYALPNLEESFAALHGSRWFSVLDLKSGYYQIEMDEADKAKTAFVTPLGFWEFNRMPQGVTNAPSTFQRLMEKCMGDLHLKEVLVFLDDLIIFSNSLEEHEQRLVRVLQRLKAYGLKLSLEKCKFFQSSVKYLGHVVSENGVETDPEKVSALKSWPIPRTFKELKSFLGFAGYYRRFISGYAAIAKPLNDLTKGFTPFRRSKQKPPTTSKHADPRQPLECWTPQCQNAFDTLIERLTTAPVLAFANPKLPYILHTDASTTGLGAALYQEQDGRLRVVAYASRGLSSSEARYPAHKLEFLALKWSVTEKFHDFLYGADFVVITDNNPLTYILTSAKLDAASHRWVAALSTYNFKLQYRAGKQNLDADALSRRPHDHHSDVRLQREWEMIRQFAQDHDTDTVTELPEEVVAAICLSSLARSPALSSDNFSTTLVESMSVTASVLPECFIDESQHGLPVISSLSNQDLQEKQRADPCLREVLHQMETGEKVPPTVKQEMPDIALLLRELNRLELHDGVLYRRRHDGEHISYQLVLPEELRPSVLTALHNDMGHMGVERTLISSAHDSSGREWQQRSKPKSELALGV